MTKPLISIPIPPGLLTAGRYGSRPIANALRKPPAVAVDCLSIIAVVMILASCLLLTHIVVLHVPFSAAAERGNLSYILTVACVVTALALVFQPRRPRHRALFLTALLAVFAMLNAIDLTFLHYFRQPALVLYPYLASPEITAATLPTYAAYVRQFVPPWYFASSVLWTLPAFVSFHLIGFRGRAPRLPAVAVAAVALAASFASVHAGSSNTASDPLTARILRIDPNMPRRPLRAVDRSGSLALLDAPRFLPRTIVLVINESTSFFNRSSEDSRVSLIDRIIGFSGDPHQWNIYRNAVTNSSCTDVSVPSILTGSGSHESSAKLHRLPFVFDIAKARGYRTAFYTSAVLEWANLSVFFSRARIDSLLTALQTGLPLINELAVDDILMMRRLAAFIRDASPQERVFIVAYPHGMHVPYQAAADLEFPPNMKDRRQRALYVVENSHRILFDALRESGRLAGALIIVTADHGEPMNPRSRLIPRVENYAEGTLRVPLLIKKPADLPPDLAAGLRANTARLVANVDIAPTIADLLGVRLPESLAYTGYSLLQKIPETRLSVATSTNEWRSWPRGAIALARNSDRFTCGHGRLCEYRSAAPVEDAAMTPIEKTAKFLRYMDEALKLPVVNQAISRMYHAHLGIAWSPPQGMARVATRSDLSSSLGDLLARAPGSAILQAPAGHAPGQIIYGPYWRLPAGRYRAEVSLELGAGGEEGEHLCTMDIYDGESILGAQQIQEDFGPRTREVAVAFEVSDEAATRPHEIRLWCAGKVSVTVNRVAFRQ